MLAKGPVKRDSIQSASLRVHLAVLNRGVTTIPRLARYTWSENWVPSFKNSV